MASLIRNNNVFFLYCRVGGRGKNKDQRNLSEGVSNEKVDPVSSHVGQDTESIISSVSQQPNSVPPPIYPTFPKTKPMYHTDNGAMTRHQIINMFSTFSDSEKER